MQKPVHIVPMWDSKQGIMRDVIMPGVGLYRMQAARTGQLAGMSEPIFGDDVTESIGGQSITYPRDCRVTIKRLLQSGEVAEFTVREFWRENYAVKGGKDKSIAPNAMWTKRPYAQLAKCAQAQALRMAFPEATGAEVTADEMEGRDIRLETDVTPPKNNILPELTTWPDADFDKNLKAWGNVIGSGKKTHDELIAFASSRHTFAPEQLARINALPVYEIEGSES